MVTEAYAQNAIPVVADTEDACRKRIRELYGDDYKIVRRQESEINGFWPFTKKKQCTLWYVPSTPSPRRAYQTMPASTTMDFNEEKAKILESNQNTQSPQMKLILDELKDLHLKFDEKTSSLRQDEHASIVRIADLLKQNDFTSEFIQKIVERIKKEFSLDDLDDFDILQKAVVDWIGESIGIAEVVNNARPEIIVLVGPTGIGKTTTIAKLAAYYSGIGNTTVPKGLNIHLITIDNFRIGAKEQFETYGDRMSIPVSSANTVEDLQQIISQYANGVDLFLIDTSGFSPKDYESLAKMRKILDLKTHKPQLFLTASATVKANDLRTILQQYEIFGYESIIVTKIDETETIGTIVSILDEKQKKIAFFTDGQKVPHNFKKADVVSFLIHLSGFTIDRDHIDEKFTQEKIG